MQAVSYRKERVTQRAGSKAMENNSKGTGKLYPTIIDFRIIEVQCLLCASHFLPIWIGVSAVMILFLSCSSMSGDWGRADNVSIYNSSRSSNRVPKEPYLRDLIYTWTWFIWRDLGLWAWPWCSKGKKLWGDLRVGIFCKNCYDQRGECLQQDGCNKSSHFMGSSAKWPCRYHHQEAESNSPLFESMVVSTNREWCYVTSKAGCLPEFTLGGR